MFKNLSNFAGLMQQAQQMGQEMQSIQEELKARRVTGSSGGGMIQATCTGIGELVRIEIDPTLVERGERDMIEDLVPAAVNDAQAKAKQMHAEMMRSMSGKLNMPGLEEALEKFTGS